MEQAKTSPADLEAGCEAVEQQVCIRHGPALSLLHQPSAQPQQGQEQEEGHEQEEERQPMTLDQHGDGQRGNHQHHHADKTPWCGRGLRNSSAILVLLGTLLLVTRRTPTIHDCKEYEGELRNNTRRRDEHREVKKHEWRGHSRVGSSGQGQDFRQPEVPA